MDGDGSRLEVLRRAVGGDTSALTTLLIESYHPLKASLAPRIPADLHSVVDADDIVQEAYVEVFQRIGGFELRDPDSFQHWVHVIALSRLRNFIKGEQAAKRGGGHALATGQGGTAPEGAMVALFDSLAGTDQTASESMARGEAVKAVRFALKAVPEHYRRAIWLVRVEGRPVKDVAAEMGRSERAIHGLCRRALTLIREQLPSARRAVRDGP